MFDYDELKIYEGDDIPITDKIIITQPTLNQIKEFGEKKYFSAVHTFVSVGADLKWQLWDIGIDYTQISDYDLFIRYLYKIVSSKKDIYDELIDNPEKYKNEFQDHTDEDINSLLINPMELILKDIDLADFRLYTLKENGEIILFDEKHDITINRFIYSQMVDIIRKIHGLKRNNEMPANEKTKMDMIEDSKDESIANLNKPYKSMLRPLISALSVYTGQCGDDRIMNMTICKFLDNIKRVNKVLDSQMLLQGAYSGFSSLKNVDKSRLDWAGDLE